MFDMVDKKPRTGMGSKDQGLNNQDKRLPGEQWISCPAIIQIKMTQLKNQF